MASSYPGSLDTLTNPSASDSMATVSHSSQHANINDAVEAIEAELGVDPAGGSATVVARLDAADTTISGKVTGPGSATDNALVRFDGTGGKTVQDSSVILSDDDTLITVASDSTAAGLRLPHGSAPSSPTNGDTWTTAAGLYVRVNGTTVGPLGTGGGGGSPTSRTVTAKTGAYTLTDSDDIINATSGTWTATLPTAVGNDGLCLTVKNSGSGVITVDGDGSTIDGDPSVDLYQSDALSVVSDGANWIVI